MKSIPFIKPAAALAAFLFAVAAMTLTAATPSHAALGSCSSGTACVWNNNTYGGSYMKASATVKNYKTISWNNASGNPNDKANSVANRGSRCAVVFYQNTSHKGAGIRFNRPASGGITSDPYLKNGGGYSETSGASSKNFQDKISSHKWVRCS
ncbi:MULTISPECIES: peptidase inhibitor family I36 protein [Brevibacterium]|nr:MULTISPECIES: peptidase inhibitor family I36 protein [Brevibacterium]AZT92735.1 hypothetical protein CXR23_05925 [Brevibacterium aurantiacum]AZT96578.1 hypothetical protein CXR27_05835 [Brevibacterium aurantiacum]PCC41238.1 hypothetical protein CIK65_18665 [Brevibacterium aurantiacum]PCC45487.1 hypothetical protein CIK64_15460 [Brevibacterium aurantiacum]PCC52044.1 hypothetical protein CIK59_18725 [Brevibacterium aurantiacum]